MSETESALEIIAALTKAREDGYKREIAQLRGELARTEVERRKFKDAAYSLADQRTHWKRRAEDLMEAAGKTGLSKRCAELEGQLDEARTERDAVAMRCERLHGGYAFNETEWRDNVQKVDRWWK